MFEDLLAEVDETLGVEHRLFDIFEVAHLLQLETAILGFSRPLQASLGSLDQVADEELAELGDGLHQLEHGLNLAFALL